MKRIKENYIIVPLILLVLVSSCIPQKELLYFQEKEAEMEFKDVEQITNKYFLQPNDYLYIRVSTFDPNLSEFFNAGQVRGGNMNASGQNTMFMYMIDDDMNIDFPYAGIINLKGCNLPMAKEKIEADLKPFVKEAEVMVKLGTKSFIILGEVGSPGVQRMDKDQLNIFEALGVSGDITVHGKKKDVKIIRPYPDGTTKTFHVDITDHRIIGSEYYYIYPNDIIYVRPMRAKQLGIGEAFNLGIITSFLAFGLSIYALTK